MRRHRLEAWDGLLDALAAAGWRVREAERGGHLVSIGEKQAAEFDEALHRHGLALVPLERVAEDRTLPEPSAARRVLAAWRDTLVDDRVIDALDWLLDAASADREYLAIHAQRSVQEVTRLEDVLADAGITVRQDGSVHVGGRPSWFEVADMLVRSGLSREEADRLLGIAEIGRTPEFVRHEPMRVSEPLEMDEYEVQREVEEGMGVAPEYPPLRCLLGFHTYDACSGVGPCLRPGCSHVKRSRVRRGGGWIRHVEPPPEGSRPSGGPRRPEPDRLTRVPGPP